MYATNAPFAQGGKKKKKRLNARSYKESSDLNLQSQNGR